MAKKQLAANNLHVYCKLPTANLKKDMYKYY